MPYNFFQNQDCEYFPCHSIEVDAEQAFSCLFCYCPLYLFEECGGNYVMLDNGWKDCSSCTLPHYNYDFIVEQIRRFHKDVEIQ